MPHLQPGPPGNLVGPNSGIFQPGGGLYQPRYDPFPGAGNIDPTFGGIPDFRAPMGGPFDIDPQIGGGFAGRGGFG